MINMESSWIPFWVGSTWESCFSKLATSIFAESVVAAAVGDVAAAVGDVAAAVGDVAAAVGDVAAAAGDVATAVGDVVPVLVSSFLTSSSLFSFAVCSNLSILLATLCPTPGRIPASCPLVTFLGCFDRKAAAWW
jgi:hypothetical protein